MSELKKVNLRRSHKVHVNNHVISTYIAIPTHTETQSSTKVRKNTDYRQIHGGSFLIKV